VLNKLIFFIFCLVLGSNIQAQSIEINPYVEAGGWIATDSILPFWSSANSGNKLSPSSDYAFVLGTNLSYEVSKNASIKGGASYFLRNGVEDELQRKELYLEFKNKWLKLTAGSKEVEDKFGGLGVVKDNFILSGNARAFPGVLAQSSQPVKLSNTLSFDWGIAHYELNDDRFVRDTRVHYKKLGISWDYNTRNQLFFGIEHYAQWGGTSPEEGPQPTGFDDFVDVFFARRGSEEASNNDQINSLGNSLGVFKFEYTHSISSGTYKLYHHHPFEDGSGTRFQNFPDGIWGFYYTPKTEKYTSILRGFIVEYVSTRNQSGATGRGGRDNYFNNSIYRSGWTYDGNTIGLPFITVPNNTRVQVFHFGITTKFKKLTTLFKGSYVNNLGTFFNPISPVRRQILSLVENSYELGKYGDIKLSVGYDLNIDQDNSFGAGLTYIYGF